MIKIPPKIINLRTRLWVITTEFVGIIHQSLALRSVVLGWILIHRNWPISVRICWLPNKRFIILLLSQFLVFWFIVWNTSFIVRKSNRSHEAQASHENKVNLNNQMMKKVINANEHNITWLNVPTGERQTSWLFTDMAEVLNWCLLRNNSS